MRRKGLSFLSFWDSSSTPASVCSFNPFSSTLKHKPSLTGTSDLKSAPSEPTRLNIVFASRFVHLIPSFWKILSTRPIMASSFGSSGSAWPPSENCDVRYRLRSLHSRTTWTSYLMFNHNFRIVNGPRCWSFIQIEIFCPQPLFSFLLSLLRPDVVFSFCLVLRLAVQPRLQQVFREELLQLHLLQLLERREAGFLRVQVALGLSCLSYYSLFLLFLWPCSLLLFLLQILLISFEFAVGTLHYVLWLRFQPTEPYILDTVVCPYSSMSLLST